MNILCRLFGHKWVPKDNPIGAVFKSFTYYDRKIICERCKWWYKDCFIEPNKEAQNES